MTNPLMRLIRPDGDPATRDEGVRVRGDNER